MDVVTVALGVGLVITIIWSSVIYLLQMIKIEELEQCLSECEFSEGLCESHKSLCDSERIAQMRGEAKK